MPSETTRASNSVVTPFKTSALFQAFLFPVAWGILFYYLNLKFKKYLNRIIPLIFVLFPIIILLSEKSQTLEIKNKKIADYLLNKKNVMLLSDELTSFRMSAFSGCSVYLSPAPFSAPSYDYFSCKKKFMIFLIKRNRNSLPKGINYVLLPKKLAFNKDYIKKIKNENGMVLYEVVNRS